MATPFVASMASSLPQQLHITTFQSFMNSVKDSSGGPSATLAAAAKKIQALIIDRLHKKVQTTNLSADQQVHLAKRLNYFKSADFVLNFLTAVPVRTKWNQNAHTTSYADWLNTVFNVSFPKWRDEELVKPTNQQQCIRALSEIRSDVHYLQDTLPHKTCYLCGRTIPGGEPTMECEHVLPVITALSHLWLVQERIENYTPEEREILKLEYSWSHRCCNRIKSNYDFIKLERPRYVINTDVINSFFTEVNTSPDDHFVCGQVLPLASGQRIIRDENRPDDFKLMPRIDNILRIINKTVDTFNDIDLYLLWTKYKILFALTDESFLTAITDTHEEPRSRSASHRPRSPKIPIYPPGGPALERKAIEEQKNSVAEFSFWKLARETVGGFFGAAIAAASRFLPEVAQGGGSRKFLRMKGGGGGGGGGPGPILTVSDVDVTFPEYFLRLIGCDDVNNLPFFLTRYILDLPTPNLIHDLATAGTNTDVTHITYNPESDIWQSRLVGTTTPLILPTLAVASAGGGGWIPSTPLRRSASEENSLSQSDSFEEGSSSAGGKTRKFHFKGKVYNLPLNGPVGPALKAAIQESRRSTPNPYPKLKFGGSRRLRKTTSRLMKTTRKTRKRN
jgi:hypothetical protein